MKLGCLSMLLILLGIGTLCLILSGTFEAGFWLSLVTVLALNLGLLMLSDRRHRRMIRRWASERQMNITDLHLYDGFLDPAPMPWWMDWSAYEMLATDSNGKSLHFSFFITGALCGVFAPQMVISMPDDYITIHSSEVNELSMEEIEKLMEKTSEERQASQKEGGEI